MQSRRIVWWLPFLLVLVSAQGPQGEGSAPPDAAPVAQETPESVSPEALAALRRELELDARLDKPTLDEDSRRQASDALEAAERTLRNVVGSIDRRAEFEVLVREAPARLAALREELARAPVTQRAEVPPGADTKQIALLRADAEAQLAVSRQALDELVAEDARRAERRTQIPGELSRARQQLEDGLEALGPAPGASAGLLERARRLRLLADFQWLRASVQELTAELASYTAREEMLPARRERAQRRLAEMESLVADWLRVESDRRRADAERVAEEARARRQSTAELSVLREYAIENERLAALRARTEKSDGTLDEVEEAKLELVELRRTLDQRTHRYANLRRKLEEVGLIPSLARLLSDEYERLDDLRELESRLRGQRARLSDAQLQAILFEEQLAEQSSLPDEVAALLANVPPAGNAEARASREAAAAELVLVRQELVAALARDYEDLYQALAGLEETSRSLLALTAEYRTYIEENILWIRSVKDVVPRPRAIVGAVAYLLDPLAWRDAIRATAEAWPRVALRVSGFLLLLVALLGFRRRMLTALRATGALVTRYSTDSYWHSLRALALTLALALTTPFLVWTLGWWLAASADQRPVAVGVGAALRHVAVLLLPLHVFAQVVRREGLAEEHFRWSDRGVSSLRRNLRWLMTALYPIVVVVWTLRAGDPDHHNSLGRIAFVVGCVLVAVFARRVLRPTGPVLGQYYEQYSDGWQARMRVSWHVLGMAAPIALGLAAAAGYYYTALTLGTSLAWTVGLLLFVVLVQAMLSRWLFVERRRLAVTQAKKRRAEALAARETDDVPTTEVPVLSAEELDLPAISAQTRQLFGSLLGVGLVLGLFMVWGDVLPALRVLDRVQVWPHFAVLEPAAVRPAPVAVQTPTNGASAATPGTVAGVQNLFSTVTPTTADDPAQSGAPVGVTLADLGLALVLLLITLAAARNVPGVMEFTLFKKLHLDAGTRYATQTIARYLILIIGVTSTFGAIGIGWREVQWLAAALTFGLAFGLQEIFANFVSGLIILFEQPIRVGDTVTVGGIDGRVTRISMRATTITDFNRKELLIPNKEFITSQFVNWTLSDSVTRVVVPVGVAYGSDTRKVRELIENAVKAVPYVLDKPPPNVIFRSFGASSLDFEVRIFIDGMDRWGDIMTGTHTAIDDALRGAGIEIAFPQLDLHLRTVDSPLYVMTDKAAAGAEAARPPTV